MFVVSSLYTVHVHFTLYFFVTLETLSIFHKTQTKSVVEGDTAWSRGLSDSKRMGD
jgi:hypothetical protein